MSLSRTSHSASAAPAKESSAPSSRIALRPWRKPCSAALRVSSRAPAGTAESACGSAPEEVASTRPRASSPLTALPADLLHLGGAGAEEDRSPGGDPDRDPDLAEGVVDPRRHAALLFRDDDLWANGYPYYFHVDYPAIANDHTGSAPERRRHDGDGRPDIAIGAPQADPAGRIDAGSVWIISGHLPPIVGCTKAHPAPACPWIKLRSLTASQGYRIDGPVAGAQLGTSLAGIGDQNGDHLGDLAIGEAGASPLGRTRAGAVVVVPGQINAVTRDLAVTAPLQTIIGPAAGSALGSSLAAAGGDMVIGAPGDSSSAGAVYLAHGAPGTTDLAAAPKIAPAAAGSMAGARRSWIVARRRQRRCADRRAGRKRLRRLVRRRRLGEGRAPGAPGRRRAPQTADHHGDRQPEGPAEQREAAAADRRVAVDGRTGDGVLQG